MGRHVLDHYPASKLPDELRGNISASATVRVIVEEEAAKVPDRQMLVDLMNLARRGAGNVSLEEAVQRVRDLRDEWD